MCNTVSDCNNRGYCIDGECLCDVAWFGDNCGSNLKTYLPRAFVTFIVIFLIIYCLIGLVSVYRLYTKSKKENHFLNVINRSSIIFTIKTLRSPYNLTMLSIFGIAITRILWLSIDPFSYEQIIPRAIERVLFECTYSLIFIIYAVVLWVWYSIYNELSQRNEKRSKVRLTCFKTKVKLFVITVVVAQMTTSILKEWHDNHYRTASLLIYSVLFIILVIVTLEYIVYGWYLYKCITDQEEAINSQYDKISLTIAQTGQAAAAYNRNGTQSISRIDTRKRASVRVEERERSKLSYLDDSEKNDMNQPSQNPDTPELNKSGSIREGLSRNPSEALRRIAAKHSSQKIIHEGMEEFEDESSFNFEGPQFRSNKHQTVPPSYKDVSQKPSLHTFFSFKKSPEVGSKKLGSIVDNELLLDRQVKEIVKKHEKHLRPVEIVEPEYENLAEDKSVIIDDSEDVMWDYVSEEEARRQEEELKEKEDKKEEVRHAISQLRMKALVIKYMAVVKKDVSDAFQMKLLDDPTYLKNYQEITKHDKVIVKKIMSLTIIAISLEVLFGIFTILVFYSPVLGSPGGMIFSLWMTGFLEVFAIFAIFMLFSIVQTQEKENLRLITRIGQNKNRINQLYGFVLPNYLRQEDSKRKLERSINQMTAKYFKSWTMAR